MPLKVRDYLENYGYKVDYDSNTGDVLVTDSSGKTKNIGSKGLALGEDGRYYAETKDTINSMLHAAGVGAGVNHSRVRNTLNKMGNSVGWLDDGGSKQVSVNGKRYNADDENFINIGGTLYAHNDYINKLTDTGYQSPYAKKIEKGLGDIQKKRFNYDPLNDSELQAAQKAAMEKVQQQLNSQGVLNSSLNALYSQRAAQELVPQYSRMAYDRYLDEQEAAYDYLSALLGIENENYNRWQNERNEDYNYNLMLEEQKAQSNADRIQKIAETIEKIRITGVVGNEDSLITGLPAGKVDYKMMGRLDELTAELIRMAQEHAYNMEILGSEQAYDLEALAREYAQEQKEKDEAFALWKAKTDYKAESDINKMKTLREWGEY